MDIEISADGLRHALAPANKTQATSDFDLNPNLRPSGVQWRAASVLVGLQNYQGRWHVVLTKRSSALRHHPGQIAFPGGKIDAEDADSISAAKREAYEEINLPYHSTEIVGLLPAHETVTGFSVTPVVALIDDGFTPTPEPSEVAEAFRVPLTHVLDFENYAIQNRSWQGITRQYYALPYGPYYIWGATARMLRQFSELLHEAQNA
ncbi:coenzyme A pyrophosphatase [Amylibacter marinus]|uniref:Coenzyme A pyrophosphatase n=1 Tax=Amylibacter marinus TaxID=1475483 RepID=A0ABQ5VWE2_9RHOB|nr:CoA pyrophosphatase [Amylibacter marinus]GLQ35381.1 coenzyme A pyrophosphatase [Amylibacter marinus]